MKQYADIFDGRVFQEVVPVVVIVFRQDAADRLLHVRKVQNHAVARFAFDRDFHLVGMTVETAALRVCRKKMGAIDVVDHTEFHDLSEQPRNEYTMSLRMKIAVLIPCYNEEATVAQVVREFKGELPEAEIVVFDNNSTDRTAERAREAGASVRVERRQGKGFVVLQMFQKIEADIYVMVDGDRTYPSRAVHRLIEPILDDRADMVVGSRLHAGSHSEFRPLNRAGNYFFASLFRLIFKANLTDVLSGYRAFNRRFVQDVPLFGGGFEVEAELTVKALQHGLRIEEVPVDLVPRPAQSQSKIRVFHDGFVILSTILALVRDYKPLTVFGGAGLILVAAGAIPGWFAVSAYLSNDASPSPARAWMAMWLISLGAVFIVAGFILHSVTRHFQELTYRLSRLESNAGELPQTQKKVASSSTSHVR